jgi:site-specific recombinase XerD
MDIITSTPLPYLVEIDRDPRLKSDHTRRAYRSALEKFEHWRDGRMLTKTLVEEYAALLQQANKSPNTINAALAVIRWWARRVADLAYDHAPREQAERIEQNSRRVVSVRDVTGSRETRGRHIPGDEIAQLLHVCTSDPSPLGARDAAMIALAAGTGARNEDLREFQLSDLKYTPEGAELKIRHGKGDKARTAYLHGGALAALNAWLDVRGVDPGPIFCRIRKGDRIAPSDPITYEGTRGILLKRFLQSAISETITWHDFRRTVAGQLFDNGTDIATVMAIGGWSDPKTPTRYDRRPEAKRRAAIQSIEVPYLPGESE